MRRLICLVLCLMMVVGVVPFTHAEASQLASGEMIKGSYIVQSARTDGRSNTTIYTDDFANQQQITGIYIPTGITEIESRAFVDCMRLSVVIIPETVTKIADDAFGGKKNVRIVAPAQSYAVSYAKAHGMKCFPLRGTSLLDAEPRDLATLLYVTDPYASSKTHLAHNSYLNRMGGNDVWSISLSNLRDLALGFLKDLFTDSNSVMADIEKECLGKILRNMDYPGKNRPMDILIDLTEDLSNISQSLATSKDAVDYAEIGDQWIQAIHTNSQYMSDPFIGSTIKELDNFSTKVDTFQYCYALSRFITYCGGDYSYAISVLQVLKDATSRMQDQTLYSCVDELMLQYKKGIAGILSKALEVSQDLLFDQAKEAALVLALKATGSSALYVVDFVLTGIDFATLVTGQKKESEKQLCYLALLDIYQGINSALQSAENSAWWSEQNLHNIDLMISLRRETALELINSAIELSSRWPQDLEELRAERNDYLSTGDPVGKIAALLPQAGINSIRKIIIPDDAIVYRGHSYVLFNEGLNWSDAKAYCESLGGHLAVITDGHEGAIIMTMLSKGVKNSYWIGGELKHGQWQWVTGEQFSYTAWGTSQPDNFTGNETALMIYGKQNPKAPSGTQYCWNDLQADGNCNGQSFFGLENMGFICEWDEIYSESCDEEEEYIEEDYSEDENLPFEFAELEDGTLKLVKYTGNDADVVIPKRVKGKLVTVIGNEAFSYCKRLTTVIIPDGVTQIGNSAFLACKSLTTINISESVTTIGYNAFSKCSNLTSVSIPDSVTSIAFFAFSECASLTTVNIPNGLTVINGGLFANCSSLTTVTIPNSVTKIWEYAFSFCTSLTTVTIPNSVTWIGENAFSCCENLTTVVFPDSVTTLGVDVFYKCPNLTLAIPRTNYYLMQYCWKNFIPYTYSDTTN